MSDCLVYTVQLNQGSQMQHGGLLFFLDFISVSWPIFKKAHSRHLLYYSVSMLGLLSQ